LLCIFERFKYKTKPEMKVNFSLKSLWSLALANEDFLLNGIRQFSIWKTSVNEDTSFEQAKFTHCSFGLS